jgi:hypothetical protein
VSDPLVALLLLSAAVAGGITLAIGALLVRDWRIHR